MSLARLRDRFFMAFPFDVNFTSGYQWRASFGMGRVRFLNNSPTEADCSVRQCTQQDADARITIASVFRATSQPRGLRLRRIRAMVRIAPLRKNQWVVVLLQHVVLCGIRPFAFAVYRHWAADSSTILVEEVEFPLSNEWL